MIKRICGAFEEIEESIGRHLVRSPNLVPTGRMGPSEVQSVFGQLPPERGNVALNPNQAVRMACDLQELPKCTRARERQSQIQLSRALGLKGHTAPTKLGSFETLANPKAPSAARNRHEWAVNEDRRQ